MMKITIRSRNGGKKLLDADRLRLLKDFIAWTATKMFSKIERDVEVVLILDSKLFLNTKTYGLSVWEDRHYRGRVFILEIDTTFKFITVLHTIAHEMVHVKQWASGEYYPVLNSEETYVFNKKKYDATTMDYWDLPWEVEAHGRSIGLLVQWMKANDMMTTDWGSESLTLY